MLKHKILITGKLDDQAIQAFQQNPNYDVVYKPDCKREDIERDIADAHVIVSRSETDVDRRLIEKAPQLKLIARAAVGVGNIDLEYATERGILVVNTPGKNTNSAAELTLGLMIGLLRKIPEAVQTVKGGGWDRHRFTGRELRGKRIGIVGLGNVGHRVAQFAHGFDMEVLTYDPYIASEIFIKHRALPCGSLKELAGKVDFLTFHVPLNRETKGMVTREILETLPKGAWLINAARGGLVDEKTLLEFLNSGHLGGAAIDTFNEEPVPFPELVKHPKVVCTPHIGASTVEAQRAIGTAIVEQVSKALSGHVVDYPVNIPEIGVLDHPGLKAYAVLAEKLGSVVGQIIPFNPQRVDIKYRGELAEWDHRLVRLSWMKGYAGYVRDSLVSFVNVNQEFEKMGIRVEDLDDPDFSAYKSALKVTVTGDQGQTLEIGGVVFDNISPRFTLLNDYYFEVDLARLMLMIENHDRPGVIGDVGHFLAHKGVNISSFVLSRDTKGGKALAVVCIDNELQREDLEEFSKIKNVIAVHALSL